MNGVALLPDVKLTPTQQKLFDKLSDGEAHTVAALMEAIDCLGDRAVLKLHLGNLRSAIYHSGYLIAGHSAGTRGVIKYQLVRRLRVTVD